MQNENTDTIKKQNSSGNILIWWTFVIVFEANQKKETTRGSKISSDHKKILGSQHSCIWCFFAALGLCSMNIRQRQNKTIFSLNWVAGDVPAHPPRRLGVLNGRRVPCCVVIWVNGPCNWIGPQNIAEKIRAKNVQFWQRVILFVECESFAWVTNCVVIEALKKLHKYYDIFLNLLLDPDPANPDHGGFFCKKMVIVYHEITVLKSFENLQNGNLMGFVVDPIPKGFGLY